MAETLLARDDQHTLVQPSFSLSEYHGQGSKAPEPWHFCGAGSGGAEGSITENCRLLLSSMHMV